MFKRKNTNRKIKLSDLWFVMVALAAFIFACGPPTDSRGAQAKAGYEHYKKHCSSCHGMDGRGIEIDSLRVQPSDLTRINARRRTADFPIMPIAKIIDGRTEMKDHGSREMPFWGDVFSKSYAMSEDEIRGELGEIIAFLMSIQRS